MRTFNRASLRPSLLLIAGIASFYATGCSRSQGGGKNGVQTPDNRTDASVTQSQDDATPKGTVTVSSGELPLPRNDGSRIDLQNGDYITLATIRGTQYLSVEATMDEASFKRAVAVAKAHSVTEKEMVERLRAPLAETIGSLSSQVGGLENIRVYPRYGFFVAMMPLANYSTLNQVKDLPSDIVLNPVVTNRLDERSVRKMDANLVEQLRNDPRASKDAFSGLKRMGVPEFLKAVKSELNTIPDGSRVMVGVTDTGVTLNHPALEAADGTSRVVYMRDFTGEGRVYFNPAATFEVTTTDVPTKLHIKAQVIAPVSGAGAVPAADGFTIVEKDILVSPELAQILTSADSKAKLGVLSEASFSSDDEKVDLNQNGKTTDSLFLILVPTGVGQNVVYFDATGALDFRKSTPVGSWNDTHQSIKVSAERFGFDLAQTSLKNAEGQDVAVLGASIVGFDPGNHGSHVSGIIAARKTINNDTDSTLARGAAPNASLMVNRVCANNGGCNATEAFVDLAENGAELVNMSLGGLGAYNDGYGVQEILIDRISEQSNVLFIISAGNSGPGINTVGSPSTARRALSVGATASRSLIERQYQWPAKGKLGALASGDKDDDDFMLFFSSRGPTAAGGFKPNIAAPGTELSSVQLNAAPGQRSGLDVYWGTSMAAPAATGAIALLLDAAKLYNAANPDKALPIDSVTMHKILTASAKPFNVNRFDPITGKITSGLYTWIDQGTGMINLPRAWSALKAERDSRLPSPVYALKDGVREEIRVDYQLRVLRQNPNGINYDGSIEISPNMMAMSGPRFGRGIWLDAKGTDSLVQVQIARRLPYSATKRDDSGDLKRLLVTSADEFVLKTVFYGSNQEWLKPGTLNQLDCATSPKANLIIVGEGAVDKFSDPKVKSTASRESTMYVCVDRAKLAALPAGDQGALIMAYRKSGRKVESNPEFIVPVYVTIPQKTLAGAAAYETTGVVQSFGVARHYVDVPAGTSLVTVTLEVPAAKVNGTVVSGCAGVRLYAYEAGNTALPKEIDGNIVRSCSDTGTPLTEQRTITYSRTNPTPGIWNLHVFGRYQFPSSEYKLRVDYAKVSTSITKIEGPQSALTGTFEFSVQDSSFDAEPAASRSTITLAGLSQKIAGQIAVDETQMIPDADGVVARTYGANVVSATFTTGGSDGNDLDLYAYECDTVNFDQATCKEVGSGTTASDKESAQFVPKADKFYFGMVIGYDVSQNEGRFEFTDTRALASGDEGKITVAASNATATYQVGFDLDQAASKVLADPLFTGGKFQATGDLTLRTDTGSVMVSIPVAVSKAP